LGFAKILHLKDLRAKYCGARTYLIEELPSALESMLTPLFISKIIIPRELRLESRRADTSARQHSIFKELLQTISMWRGLDEVNGEIRLRRII
jgi:hypothetical protein